VPACAACEPDYELIVRQLRLIICKCRATFFEVLRGGGVRGFSTNYRDEAVVMGGGASRESLINTGRLAVINPSSWNALTSASM
jgi:hypothetical protein